MKPFYYLFGIRIPAYGSLIVLALIFSNLWIYAEHKDDDLDNIILLECFGGIGAIAGAKLLFLLVNASQIDWSRFFEKDYFRLLMDSGFVFLGGLFGAILMMLVSQKLHITHDALKTVDSIAYVIPAAHAIGRIGCFCAGCCYGIPYSGPGAVHFPPDSLGPSGVSVFPVQLLESLLLAVLSFILYRLYKKHTLHPTGWYVFLYCILRFFTEMLRGDNLERGVNVLSTSQWISLLTVCAFLICHFRFRNKPAES